MYPLRLHNAEAVFLPVAINNSVNNMDVTEGGDKVPLLNKKSELKQRKHLNKEDGDTDWVAAPYADWNPDLPYGGKVYLAKRHKPDSLVVRIVEASVVVLTLAFACYAFFYFDNLHFHITHGYARLGYSAAQNQVGQRYMHGIGAEKDHHAAMSWFKMAADQGHAHAAYNVAVGHLQGIRTDLLRKGEAHKLIQHAASEGVKEASEALNKVCSHGGCD